MTAGLWTFWEIRGYFSEGRNWLLRAVDLGRQTVSPALAQSLGGAALVSTVAGDPAEAKRLATEGVRIARLTGDSLSIGIAVFCAADVEEEVGDQRIALDTYLESVEVFRSIEEWVYLALALANAGATAVSLRRYDDAVPLLEETLDLSRTAGFDWGIGMCQANLGRIALERGDLAGALEYVRQSLQVWLTMGDQLRIVRLLERMAAIAAADRQPILATRLLGAADARLDTFDVARTAGSVQAVDMATSRIEPQLNPDAIAEAWNSGRALSIEEAIAEALAFELSAAPAAPTPVRQRTLLSAREMEVLELLVAGWSDRQIAEKLFISHRTAQGHVGSIFNKLGVNSRTAAATTAIRIGLIDGDGDRSS
jgi:non-specific serine/threonine protein kinase